MQNIQVYNSNVIRMLSDNRLQKDASDNHKMRIITKEEAIIMHEIGHPHHEHTHENITAFESVEQAVKVLDYMLDHNKHHAEEVHEICHKLELSGEAEAAEFLDKAVDAFREGNTLMENALRLLKKEEN